jgi:hypothetical protein
MFHLLTQKLIAEIPYSLIPEQEDKSIEEISIFDRNKTPEATPGMNIRQLSKNNVYIKFDHKKWNRQLVKVFKHMVVIEKNKVNPPYYSQHVAQLVKYYHF